MASFPVESKLVGEEQTHPRPCLSWVRSWGPAGCPPLSQDAARKHVSQASRSSEPRSKQTKHGGLRAPPNPQPGKQSRGGAVRLPRCSLQRQAGGKAAQAKEAADPHTPCSPVLWTGHVAESWRHHQNGSEFLSRGLGLAFTLQMEKLRA